ncbi:MAG: bifunctional aldolase/short-chain dehydrogenase [Candidatus Ruthia sp.]|nr:bifunctional aldolase/short-chain dehydrogenase [Candidatus Ruthturnera sp.]MBT4764454.1 bifunctional aldolase/short-chain dehydrogenase [bacterium]
MKNLWNSADAKSYSDDLALRVYTSRLLGQDPTLVLHGGGNTSVKITETNIVGEQEEILYVKGSGWDLVSIEKAGFSPVRMAHMLKLGELDSLSDPQMVNELKTQLTDASAPGPSVETILHAILPFKYVDHTHADTVVTISNTANGEDRIREIYGDRVVVVPYVMPGFDLSKDVGRLFSEQANDKTEGMILLNHGIFSFGTTAKQAYDRMIDLVDLAEKYLVSQNAWEIEKPSGDISSKSVRNEVAQLRQDISTITNSPVLFNLTNSKQGVDFSNRDDITSIATRGPVTPDHVIRTKRIPMIGRDVKKYTKEYKTYFDTHEPNAKDRKTMLDSAPRVILDQEFGLCAVGKNMGEIGIISDLYEHTMQCILRAEKLGGWQALPASDIFDLEYWDLEQAKLQKGGSAPEFQGEVVLITGAASGIGKACVESFLARGCAVIGIDLDPSIKGTSSSNNYLGLICDVADEDALKNMLESGVRHFGGIDMVVLNAGIFPGGKTVAELDTDEWRKVFSINLDANLILLREVYPLLKLAPDKGRVVIIGSKNVPAPGPGAASYSASKAALNQLMRVLAMEWGNDGIRLNTLHPNAVFDTGIWTDEVLQARAKHYGLSVKEYKTNNIMKVEVSSVDVAELAAEMCGALFSKTTAAQVPVDGGNDRVI